MLQTAEKARSDRADFFCSLILISPENFFESVKRCQIQVVGQAAVRKKGDTVRSDERRTQNSMPSEGLQAIWIVCDDRNTGERTHIVKAAQHCRQIHGEREKRRKRSDGAGEGIQHDQ